MYVVMVRTGEQGMYLTNQIGLRSKSFQSSYCMKVTARAKETEEKTGAEMLTTLATNQPLCYIPAKFLLQFFSLHLTSHFLKSRLISFSLPHSSYQVLKEFRHLLLKREHQV